MGEKKKYNKTKKRENKNNIKLQKSLLSSDLCQHSPKFVKMGEGTFGGEGTKYMF